MRVWHGVAIRYALLQQVMIHDQRAPFRVVLSGCARYFLSGDGLVQGESVDWNRTMVLITGQQGRAYRRRDLDHQFLLPDDPWRLEQKTVAGAHVHRASCAELHRERS